MDKIKNAFLVLGLFVGIFCTSLLFISNKISKRTEGSFTDLAQKIYSVDFTKRYEFAGEEVPSNDDTRERLDRELSVNSYWQSNTLLNIKMAHKLFPIIESILEKNGIPDDFKYLAVAESNLRNASSPAGAKGYWQFMKPAAEEFGLVINTEVDERFHIEKSTQAACEYLHQMHRRFGTWSNVAGAYNIGPTAFARNLEEQKEKSYYDVNLNEETSRYLFRIISFKEIMKAPEQYGYYVTNDQKYAPLTDFREIEVTSTISSLSDFAHDHNISYRLLKFYNPWLISTKLTVMPGKSFIIKVPRE
jgi:hypothetical protein